ncbi:hypothetical protein V1387_08780 [Allomuricauda taeanensis]|uniref:hypothetical protein n=1 Tax=Flagellimonas taeanensis TaxID=1005926 RepID=UPI002E7C49F0|nr:hypothetical protein [Allomuricauda taeanensis]MEE1962775.1 hypothetical protein [Allomuricauda taeanensis]
MNKCIDCGELTLNGHPRYHDCWYDYQIEHDAEFGKQEFLKEVNFNYQLLKGKIAELIIERLLILCDFEVHKFGMENSLPMFPDSLYDPKSKIGQEIRSMPDFVVIDHKERVNYFEIKYRRDGIFKYESLGQDYKYTNGYLILVSKNNVQAIAVRELEKIKVINPHVTYELWDLEGFDFDEVDIDVINSFKKIVKNVFSEL